MTQHPRTRSRTAAAVAGVAMAAASAVITQLDVSARTSTTSPTITVTTSGGQTSVPVNNLPSVGGAPAAVVMPDPTVHPGAVNSQLGTAQLCSAGFSTSTIRPPTSYTDHLKQLELADGGSITAPDGTTYIVLGEHLPGAVADYELDHLISLELGGDPVDPKNL